MLLLLLAILKKIKKQSWFSNIVTYVPSCFPVNFFNKHFRISKNGDGNMTVSTSSSKSLLVPGDQAVLKRLYKPHTHNFRACLVELVITQRLAPTDAYKVRSLLFQLPQPALPPNIVAIPKQYKEEATAKHKVLISKVK